MNYKFIYKRKEDGRKVYSKVPLNYEGLELISQVKNVAMTDGEVILKKKYKRK